MHHQPAEHTAILNEEFVLPIQGPNISVVQTGSPDQMVNYAPIVHTIPAGTEGFIYDVDPSTPLLILTSISPAQIGSTNESPSVIEIPLQSNEVSKISPLFSAFVVSSVTHKIGSQCNAFYFNGATNR